MRSQKLFSIVVLAGTALAAPLAASCSSSPEPNPKSDSGSTDGDPNQLLESSAQDTGTGAEFW